MIFTRLIPALFAAMLLVSAPLRADLLDDTLELPLISFNGGTTSFDAANRRLTLESLPASLLPPSGPPPVDVGPAAGVESISLSLITDAAGNFASGEAFELVGEVTFGGNTYSGTLLTGTVSAFGFSDSGGTTDTFDFRVTLSGGLLAGFYNDEIGVFLTSEMSNFTGSFTTNFDGAAKGQLGKLPAILASLGDFVWEDLNADGIQDAGEPGVPGVTVRLYSNPDGDGSCDSGDEFFTGQSTMTDANGEYGFDMLPAGDYCVEFMLPPGFSISPQDQGGDDARDSDADPMTGRTVNINLDPGEDDPTWDAGIFRQLASLGDFVWEDLNADGIQDSGEPGVEGVNVLLFSNPDGDGACDSGDEFFTGQSTMTDANGAYGFDMLPAGDYCVEFMLPAGYSVSPQDMGADDAKDSDADPVTGRTANIMLEAGEDDPTWDAGIYRPARLGDYVWLDENRDGIQDPGENGIEGVVVNLLDCSGNPILEADGVTPVFTFTDANGMYLFDNLVPGSYLVEFIRPAGLVFSPKEQGASTDLDSNADLATGLSGCVTLESGDEDLSIDAGLYLPVSCDLDVSKSCEILTPVINPSNFVCSDAKPIDQLSMIWNGSQNIDVVAHYGKLDDEVLTTVNNVAPGDEVTISGFAGAGNDVEWELFVAGTNNSLGKSGFHMSCSDPEMDGPSSCGLPQGNNKSNSDGLNDWLFEGMAGSNGMALDCTSPQPPIGGTGVTACEFETALDGGCDGRVIDLDLRYNGGDCSITPNNQEGRASCEVGNSGMPVPVEPVRIRVSDGGSKVFLDTGVANVMLGDIVSATSANASEDDFSSNTVVEIFDSNSALVQTIEIHTSCSKPLNLGDRFGGLEVVTINSKDGGLQSLGREVRYSYLFTNNSGEAFSGSAIDSGVGGIVDPLDLAPGESLATSVDQFVVPDASGVAGGTVVVSGQLSPSGLSCEADASTTVTRIVQLPDCSVEGENKLNISDDKIEWKLFNTGNDPLTVESISVIFPSNPGEERGIEKVKLDGDIFKNGDVKSPALIDSFVGDLKNRQIKVGDDRKLEIEFTDKVKETLPSDYEITVNFIGGCSVTLDTTSPVGNYECNKPIDQLTMIWTGSENVSVEAWKGSVGSTSLGVQSVAPGDEVTFVGFAGSPNDVFWEISDGMGSKLGESKFHLSCSDGDMNGPEDCGKAQGNGKDDDGSLINLWLLEGIVDDEGTLNCTP